MNTKKVIFSIACIVGVLSIIMFLLKDFNLSWVKVKEDRAVVTINFLVPMETKEISQCIQLENDPAYDNNYVYEINWLNNRTCEIILTEKTKVRGQKINLHIQNAPTQYTWIKKDAVIPIQFKSNIQIESPKTELIIATNQSFNVVFNTPMDEQKIHKYIESDGEFIIEPSTKTGSNNKEAKDLTTYTITPKVPLVNESNYILSFRKGMPSLGGTLLEQDQKIRVTTDQKPQITSVTPTNNSKWIGLYPRIVVESSTPMVNAYMTLDNYTLKGVLKNEYCAIFYPKVCLQPSTSYNMTIHIESSTGEKSDKEQITFTTVPIKEDRIWIEIVSGDTRKLNVYKGQKKIQSFTCSTGSSNLLTPYGTYYVQSKKDSYISDSYGYGANYCTELTEGIKIHGLMRDESWEIKSKSYKKLGSAQESEHIILSEQDASWIFDNIPGDTMVIIHPGK